MVLAAQIIIKYTDNHPLSIFPSFELRVLSYELQLQTQTFRT